MKKERTFFSDIYLWFIHLKQEFLVIVYVQPQNEQTDAALKNYSMCILSSTQSYNFYRNFRREWSKITKCKWQEKGVARNYQSSRDDQETEVQLHRKPDE